MLEKFKKKAYIYKIEGNCQKHHEHRFIKIYLRTDSGTGRPF